MAPVNYTIICVSPTDAIINYRFAFPHETQLASPHETQLAPQRGCVEESLAKEIFKIGFKEATAASLDLGMDEAKVGGASRVVYAWHVLGAAAGVARRGEMQF